MTVQQAADPPTVDAQLFFTTQMSDTPPKPQEAECNTAAAAFGI